MCGVLHPHSHNHGHGHSHGKDKEVQDSKPAENGSINITLKDFSSSSLKCGEKLKFWQRKKHQQHNNKHGSEENINVRAAFIHVIGDLIQSIGVVIAGYIIWFKVLKKSGG
jgi:zinc transporter 2